MRRQRGNALRRLASAALACAVLPGLGFMPASDDVAPYVAPMPGVGIVVATIDGERSEVRSFGTDLGGESSFEIGSITKTFTATLFADMVVHHEVSPDDPIERYLPAGARAPTFGEQHITLLDLATQTSGLPRLPTNLAPANANDPYADYDETKLLAFLGSYALPRAPGATFEYSNLGVGLLGYLLARRLGVDYATAVRTRVLEPLGMTHTVIAEAGRPPGGMAGHDADGEPVSNWTFGALAGAGAVVSTPDDMLRFARANLDETGGPLAAAMALAHRPLRDAGNGTRVGYAWLTQPDGVVWHNGGTAGFRSFIGLAPAQQRAVVVLADGFVDAVDGIGMHVLDPNLPLPAPPQPDAPVTAEVLARYVGRYRFSDGSTGTVTQDARGLIVAFDIPKFRARLHARADDRFAIRTPAIDVTFSADGETMSVAQPGSPADTGTRLK